MNAFGQLKARWCGLFKQNNMQVDKIPNVITARCILHTYNICDIHGDPFDTAWLEELENTSSLMQPTPPT